ASTLELSLDLFEIEGLAVGDRNGFDGATESLGEGDPTFAELSSSKHKDFVAGRGQVGNRRFHRASTGGSQHHDVVLGADECLQVRKGTFIKFAEFRGSVVEVCRGHCHLRRWEKRRRPRREEPALA